MFRWYSILWGFFALLLDTQTFAASNDSLPISGGSYVRSQQDCKALRAGTLEMIDLEVSANRREYGVPEAGCVVANVKKLRQKRFLVTSDCTEAGEPFQQTFILDLVSNTKIKMDGTALLLCGSKSQKSKTETDKVGELIGQWHSANEGCRGGLGDDAATFKQCNQRDALGARLSAAKWCYGREGQSSFEYEWHRCTEGSIKG
jgi:hypothetical protein